jgi:hypothetical protein
MHHNYCNLVFLKMFQYCFSGSNIFYKVMSLNSGHIIRISVFVSTECDELVCAFNYEPVKG